MDICAESLRLNKRALDFSSAPSASTEAELSAFSPDAGEVVTINASYAPASASVDFGLIDSDDVFHCINVKNGSINQGITIETRGQYTLAIRNNSSSKIDVSGFVNY